MKKSIQMTKRPNDAQSKDNMTPQAPIDRLRTLILFVFPALGGLLFGYDIGASSSALPILETVSTSGVSWGQFSTLTAGIVTSSSLFGALVGSLAAFLLKDRAGRKAELLFAAGSYGVGAVLSTAAQNVEMLVLGKLIYGLGIAFALHAAPAYLAEMGHPKIRGLLIGLKEVFIGIGIELGLLIGLPCLDIIGGWRIVFGIAILPAVVMAVGMAFLPESPRWLLLAGKPERARAALVWARGKAAGDAAVLDKEFDDITSMSSDLNEVRGLFFIFQRRFLRQLGVGLSLMFFQQVTGQPSVLYYATKMFEKAGLRMGAEATGIAGVLGAFKLAMTCIAVFTVDNAGRRPLLLFGVAGMFFSALLVGIATLISYGSMAVTYISIVGLFGFIGSYQMSFGPISWIMVGEVFPLAVRGPAIALATLTNFGTNFVVTLVLPSIQKVFGIGWLYVGFALMTAVSWVVIFLIVPETKGRTLEEIEAVLLGKNVLKAPKLAKDSGEV